MVSAKRPVSPARAAGCGRSAARRCFEQMRGESWPSQLVCSDEPVRLPIVQTSLAQCAAGSSSLEAGAAAELRTEPGNPHDPDALAVYIGGEQAGYLRRGSCRRE